MYVPAAFAIHDPAVLHEIMVRNSFALLVSETGGEPFATHLPLLFDPNDGPKGTIRGHLARANPHAELLSGKRTLAVFSGPHAYISPTWYLTENTVPTWNYVAVHAYGTCERIDDESELLQVLTDSVATYESGMPSPWRFDPDSEFVRKLAAAIVGFRIPIDRIEGKAKLSQNHPPERRERVIHELEQATDPSAREIEKLMRGMK